MKTGRKNRVFHFGLMLLLIGAFFVMTKEAQAASKKLSVLNSYNKKSCQLDLDGDGKKEKLKLKISSDDMDITKVVLQVNGYNALTLQNFSSANPHTVLVDYVKVTKKNIFIRVRVSGDSDFVYVDNFYRYNSDVKKMKKEVCLLDTEGWGADGTITGVNSSGIKVSYHYQFSEIGSIQWTYTYVVKNKKLKPKSNSVNAASVYTTDNNPDGYGSLFVKNRFKAIKSIKLYTETSMKKIAYTAKKNDILTLKKVKYADNKFYVQFSKGNKKGWIKLNESKYNPLFYGVENRLAG